MHISRSLHVYTHTHTHTHTHIPESNLTIMGGETPQFHAPILIPRSQDGAIQADSQHRDLIFFTMKNCKLGAIFGGIVQCP